MSFSKNILARALLALIFPLLAGCGGSGSSGFDATGSGAGGNSVLFQEEQAAIESVTESGGCRTIDDLIICSQEPVSDGSPDSRGTRGVGKPSIFMDPVSHSLVDCTAGPLPGECTFPVSIVPSNFPFGTLFFPVARIEDSASPWLMDGNFLLPSPGIPVLLEGGVRLEGLIESEGETVQLAILAYLPDTSIPGPSSDSFLLGTLAPDYAFVAAGISLVIQ